MSAQFQNPTEARRHELLADAAEQVAQRLITKHGMDEESACDVGNHLADFLADHWKGQNIYMPGDQAYKLNARDWEIFNRFQRGNSNELAKEFGVSKVRIHQIYKRCLVQYRASVQNSLFADQAAAAEKP